MRRAGRWGLVGLGIAAVLGLALLPFALLSVGDLIAGLFGGLFGR